MTIRRTPRLRLGALLGACLSFAGVTVTAYAAPPTLLVFAAASLTDALDEADGAFTAQTQIPIKASYAASSALAKQIEAGAHADVFFSADEDWMDYLDTRGLLRSSTRTDVVGNTLVLIAPLQSPVRLQITPGFPLLAALGGGRLATADPDSVPA